MVHSFCLVLTYQSIIAICLVGEVAGLKSELEGLLIEDMKRWSEFNVGLLHRCMVCLLVARPSPDMSSSSCPSSSSSSSFSTMLHPGGKADRLLLRSLTLNESPPKTGVTVIFCPFGRWHTDGGMVYYVSPAELHLKYVVGTRVRSNNEAARPLSKRKIGLGKARGSSRAVQTEWTAYVKYLERFLL